jgi:hypothetical protein
MRGSAILDGKMFHRDRGWPADDLGVDDFATTGTVCQETRTREMAWSPRGCRLNLGFGASNDLGIGETSRRCPEFQMDERIRAFDEVVEYQIAVRRFESAFEACKRLSHENRQLLLKEVANRLSQHMPDSPSEEQTKVKVIGVEIKQS